MADVSQIRQTTEVPAAVRFAYNMALEAATAFYIAGHNLEQLDCYDNNSRDAGELRHWVVTFGFQNDALNDAAGRLHKMYPALLDGDSGDNSGPGNGPIIENALDAYIDRIERLTPNERTEWIGKNPPPSTRTQAEAMLGRWLEE